MKVPTVLTNAAGKVSAKCGKIALKFSKNSPEVMIGVGVVGIVVATVLACKETLNVNDILEDHEYKLEKLDEIDYPEEDRKKEVATIYKDTYVSVVRNYAPSAITMSVSIFLIIKGHDILRKRYIATVAAYEMLDNTFKKYRERVKDELGDDADQYFKNGVKKEKIEWEEKNDKGKIVKKKGEVDVFNPNSLSPYAKIFDESCKGWTKDPEYNLVFLSGQQRYFNDLLASRGHVFLNEVYDSLGIPRTSAGSVVGWVIGSGDNFVDFGIYDVCNDRARDFVNGYERSIILDFNVDGVIYDKI